MTNQLTTLSTLQQRITAIADRMAPAGDDGVAKALRTLQTGGLALSANIKPKDMNTVYSYALSGLSHDALTTVCKKLVRGEYDIDRKAFIPLPPEMAAMVRAEQRPIIDDLSRARAALASIQPETPVERSPEEQARVKALRLQFLNAHQDFKERNGLAHTPTVETLDEEKAAYFARILSLKDAPTISPEQHAERSKRSAQIASVAKSEQAA